ncbi:alkylated DNA repair protein domain-containing protein, partial [Pseudomonas syringae]|uniref:alkylated DNA repair protein domain-containing protein n=1 Tax=Pseudomonas syringae TaxID=317 RepID=UPI0034D7B961
VNGDQVEQMDSFKFLVVIVKEDQTWGIHITVLVKRGQQRLYCLRFIRNHQLHEKLLVTFYHCV